MKNFFWFYSNLAFLTILLLNCTNNQDSSTSIKIDKTIIDLGKINIGEKKIAKFKIKNTGKKSLLIENIEPDCYCTIPEWDKLPIEPNNSTIVEVHVVKEFEGIFQQVVTLHCNTKEKKHLLVVRGLFINP